MKLQVMQGFWNAKVVQFPLQPTQQCNYLPIADCLTTVCNTMVAFRALINLKEREGERRSPHPGKNAIFIATLQTMVVVRLANLLHLAPPLDSFRIDHPCSMHLHRAMIAGGWWGQPSMFIDYHPMS